MIIIEIASIHMVNYKEKVTCTVQYKQFYLDVNNKNYCILFENSLSKIKY